MAREAAVEKILALKLQVPSVKEKETNYALQAGNKEEFVKAVTEGLKQPPQYFPLNAKINKEGYESLDAILGKGLKPLTVAEVKKTCK